MMELDFFGFLNPGIVISCLVVAAIISWLLVYFSNRW
jgi:hypothetical protein